MQKHVQGQDPRELPISVPLVEFIAFAFAKPESMYVCMYAYVRTLGYGRYGRYNTYSMITVYTVWAVCVQYVCNICMYSTYVQLYVVLGP